MTMARFLVVLATGIFILAAPITAPAQDEPIAVTAPEDAAIAERIGAIYKEIAGFGEVTVTVNAGVVHLSGTILTPEERKRAIEIAERVEGVVAVETDLRVGTSAEERVDPALERARERLGSFVDFLPILLIGIALFALFWTAGWLLSRAPLFKRVAPNSFVRNLLRQVIILFFALSGALLALDVLGATALFGSVLGAAGVLGIALGFGLRDTMENYIASVLLSLRQPFAPDDHILVEGQEGIVARLTSRATILVTFDGNSVRLPNSLVFRAVIVNFTQDPERRFTFEISVSRAADPTVAQNAVLAAVKDTPGVLAEPAPAVSFDRMTDYALVLVATGWVNQHLANYATTRSEAIRAALIALERCALPPPAPTYNLRNLEDRPDEGQPPQAPAEIPPMPEIPAGTSHPVETIRQKAADERKSASDTDLLSRDAPQE